MKISGENSTRSKSAEGTFRQQTRRSNEQLEDAGAKFSDALQESETAIQTKDERDKRKDGGGGDGVVANTDHKRAETPAVAKDAEAPVTHEVNSIAQQIAARILVSPPGAANPEVRIQLKESVLQGSDVRVFREGGALKVVFVASNQSAADFIASNRDAMTASLSNRLPGERVDISIETQQAERERGDGRSRQQYVADEDAGATGIGR